MGPPRLGAGWVVVGKIRKKRRTPRTKYVKSVLQAILRITQLRRDRETYITFEDIDRSMEKMGFTSDYDPVEIQRACVALAYTEFQDLVIYPVPEGHWSRYDDTGPVVCVQTVYTSTTKCAQCAKEVRFKHHDAYVRLECTCSSSCGDKHTARLLLSGFSRDQDLDPWKCFRWAKRGRLPINVARPEFLAKNWLLRTGGKWPE